LWFSGFLTGNIRYFGQSPAKIEFPKNCLHWALEEKSGGIKSFSIVWTDKEVAL